jgi:hypothetical protein
MKTVLCRPEVNALTMPQSYSVRHIPRDTVGYGGVAERMARNNPGLTKTQAETNLRAAVQAMLEALTLTGAARRTLSRILTCASGPARNSSAWSERSSAETACVCRRGSPKRKSGGGGGRSHQRR